MKINRKLLILGLVAALFGGDVSAYQDGAESAPPGVGVDSLGRVPAAGESGDDLTVMRVTLEPGASLPPLGASGATVMVIESGRLEVELRSGEAHLALAGTAEATPLAAGAEALLHPGDAVSFGNGANVDVWNAADVEVTLLISTLLAAGESVFAASEQATGSFSVETFACPAGMTIGTLDPAACAVANDSLIQWSLASDQFAAPLGLDEATMVGATTTWSGLPAGTYFVDLTAESFAPGYGDYFIPSSNQVTRQDERTTRIYYDAIRSRGTIRAYVLTEDVTATS